MIWRWDDYADEGRTLRYGINWTRSGRTHLEVMLAWRAFTHRYSVGFRIRNRFFGSMWLWRPLRRSCLSCDWRRDIWCARCWPATRSAA